MCSVMGKGCAGPCDASCSAALSRCTEADPAPEAGGSFLLAPPPHVNGCKILMESISADRLPPLVPAATGERMGVHINLLRNL